MRIIKMFIAMTVVALILITPDGPGSAIAEKVPTTTTTTTTTVPAVKPAPLVSAATFAAWYKVAWCETHADWDRNQPNFDGGLGISRVVWIEFGGQRFAPAPHLATPMEQVFIATRINAGYDVPDQDGACHAW